MALVRDTAVQKLRDLTIAVAVVSAAAVALIAWVSAATIPGNAATVIVSATIHKISFRINLFSVTGIILRFIS